MIRKLHFLVLISIIFLPALQGHAAEFKADPVFSYESKDNEYTLRSIGPIFEFSQHVAAVRPFYYKDKDTSETDILYPLGRSTKDRGLFFPIYRRTDEDAQHHVDLFPIFYGTYKGNSYGGVFPIYGTMDHRFGYDKTMFVLFPLYVETDLDEASYYSFLWPVFSYSKGRLYRVFPLYGWKKSTDTTSQFLLWPIFFHRRGPDERKMDAALPLFRYDRGPTYWNMSVIWPFFNYNRDYANNFTSADFPWPLIRTASGAYEETRIFPFYWFKTDMKKHTWKTIAWPLWSRSTWHFEETGLDEETTMILLTNWITKKTMQDGQTSQKMVLWPFLYTYRDGERSEWHFPSLVPLFFDQRFARIWGPVLSIAEGSSSDASSETSILWRTIRWGNEGEVRDWSISFLVNSKTTPEYHEWGFLGNLLTFRRTYSILHSK